MLVPQITGNQMISVAVDEKSIVETTTRCFKDCRGKWSYSGKIKFRKGQTIIVHTVYGQTFEHLLKEVKKEMVAIASKPIKAEAVG